MSRNCPKCEGMLERDYELNVCPYCGTRNPAAPCDPYVRIAELKAQLTAEWDNHMRAETEKDEALAEVARLQEALGQKTIANSDIACTAESMGQRVPMTGHVTTEETP